MKTQVSMVTAIVNITVLMLAFTLLSSGNITTYQESSNNNLRTTSQFIKENCICLTPWRCECCAKVDNDLLNIHQKSKLICADWIISTKSWDIRASVRLNGNTLYTNTFFAANIPAFCVPIWPGLAITGCLQIHSIDHHDYNTLHGCANATLNFISLKLIDWPIGCMDIGVDGLQLVDADHSALNTTQKPPEIELETSDILERAPTKTIVTVDVNEKF
uniref:DUF4773 domain-containing protein n=1 Tax=Glossina austeni TaxID=7395 RepID=A0A1A9V5Z2_GLOAU